MYHWVNTPNIVKGKIVMIVMKKQTNTLSGRVWMYTFFLKLMLQVVN